MSDPFVGTLVGRYRVLQMLGRGGMGRVYEGAHEDIGSRVAIKLMADEYAHDDELAERVLAEARAVNLIRHEAIVNIYDLLRLPDGRPVIVMELLDGVTLRERLRMPDVPLGGLISAMIDVLGALGAAHAIGVVHRDLKPDNIFVTRGGRTKVLDFGIAKLLRPPQGVPVPRTRTGRVLGTPEYMAPEQVSQGIADPRSDLYALGVMLFEALAGRRPFEGVTDFEVMRAHLEQPPPPLRPLHPDLPVELEQVVLTALAKRPTDRFASAAAMAYALQVASRGLPDAAWRSLARPDQPIGRPSVPAHDPSALALLPTARSGKPNAETDEPATVRLGGGAIPPARGGRLDAETAPMSPRRGGRVDAETVPIVAAGGDRGAAGADSAERSSTHSVRRVLAASVGVLAVTVFALWAPWTDEQPARSDAVQPAETDAGPRDAAVHDEPATDMAATVSDGAVDAWQHVVAELPVDAATRSRSRRRESVDAGQLSRSSVDDVLVQEGPRRWRARGTYDPDRVDIMAVLPRAEAAARQVHSSAVLRAFSAGPVRADGTVDLDPETSGRQHFLHFDFSTTLTEHCNVRVVFNRARTIVVWSEKGDACTGVARRPRCTIRQIWAKSGAEPDEQISIDWNSYGGGTWYVQRIKRGGHDLADDC